MNDVTVHNHILSDHYTVRFKSNAKAKSVKSRVRLVRKFKELDKQKFCAEGVAQLANSEPTENPDELTRLFHLVMNNVLDNNVPLKKVTIKGNIRKPWYNDGIHEQRKIRRQKNEENTFGSTLGNVLDTNKYSD